MAGVKRKIYVPGTTLELATVVFDEARNRILAISHEDGVIMVILTRDRCSAHLMNQTQAKRFSADVLRLHQAIADDAKISQMEQEFRDGEEDDEQ